jgi:hypothetical protein
MDEFCMKCGSRLSDGVCTNCSTGQNDSKAEDAKPRRQEKYKRFFTSPKEEYVAVLGNSYIETFLKNGGIQKAFAILSDKRAYFQGTSYEVRQNYQGKRRLVKTRKSRTIDLKDITGTGIDSYSRPLYAALTYLFLLLPPLLCAAYLLIIPSSKAINSAMIILAISVALSFYTAFLYKYKLEQYICIQYAGGEIAFSMSWYNHNEVTEFQKQLRIAKDKAVDEADNAVANKLQRTIGNVMTSNANQKSTSGAADELIKYGQLLQNGLITQEEFDKVKKELLNL